MNPLLYQIFPAHYENLMRQALPYAQERSQKGLHKLVFVQTPASQVGEATKKAHAHNEWSLKLHNLIEDPGEVLRNPEVRDSYIDLLRVEPDTEPLSTGRMLEARYAGINLIDIEGMALPLSLEGFNRITDYVIAALSSQQDEAAFEVRQDRIIKLFLMGPTIFHKQFEPANIRNKKMLATINQWQEAFLITFLMDKDPVMNQKAKDFLKVVHSSVGLLLIEDLAAWATRPYILDPDYSVQRNNSAEILPRHPLSILALEYAPKLVDDVKTFHHVDTLGYGLFRDILLPRLQERIAELGYEDKFRQQFEDTKGLYEKKDIESEHVEEIRRSFEYMSGTDFLEKLQIHTDELTAVAGSCWNSLFEQINTEFPSAPMHFLPMSEGFNIIGFPEDEMVGILGFKDLRVQRLGTPQQWEIALEFRLKAGGLTIIGKLDQQGSLHLNDPIKEQTPQLYTLVSLIATLAFRDLVVQKIKEQKEGKSSIQPASKGEQPSGEDVDKTDEAATEIQIYRSFGGFLPRRQTDKELIKAVYRHTGLTPRRVEIHRMWLQGADEYAAAVNLYNEAQASGASRQEIERMATELAKTRKRSKKASGSKVKSIPPHLQLEHVTDPITKEVRYLRTWVVEHTSPKPTDAELRSPFMLFERYYKRASSLSFLDQLKPWLIGE